MPGFDAATLAAIGAVSLAVFVVRGLSGFGSSMVGIGGLSLLLPPAQVVPAFLALELLTTLHLRPGIWRQVGWRSMRWLVAGCANPMRLAVSTCLLLIAPFMLSGAAQRVAQRQTPGPLGALGVGMASGVLNGAAGIGGPPVIVFYFATTGAAVSRASLIAYFVFTDVCALAWAGGTGLLARVAWPLIVVALPFSLTGVGLGQRLYRQLDEARLRRRVWCLLAALGALGALGAANAAGRVPG